MLWNKERCDYSSFKEIGGVRYGLKGKKALPFYQNELLMGIFPLKELFCQGGVLDNHIRLVLMQSEMSQAIRHKKKRNVNKVREGNYVVPAWKQLVTAEEGSLVTYSKEDSPFYCQGTHIHTQEEDSQEERVECPKRLLSGIISVLQNEKWLLRGQCKTSMPTHLFSLNVIQTNLKFWQREAKSH